MRDGRPGLGEMALALAKATAEHVAGGCRMASPEVQEERKRICFSCNRHDHVHDACAGCGCGTIDAATWLGLDLKLKRSWASSVCPLDTPKWDKV